MTTTTTTNCPAWCTEHAYDIDGSILSHLTVIPVEAPSASVAIGHDLDTGQIYVDPQANGGNMWTSQEARSFAAALLVAADHADGREPLPWARLTEWFTAVINQDQG